MGWESDDVVRFDLEPRLQGQTRTAKLKCAYNLLIIDPRDLGCETNLLIYHGLGIFLCSQIRPLAPPSRSNYGSLVLVSCLAGGYQFALVL